MAVYFIRCSTGEIKIGTAANIRRRVAVLQTAHPATLELLAAIPGDTSREQSLHERFERERVRGEWFEPSERLLSFIDGLALATTLYEGISELAKREDERDARHDVEIEQMAKALHEKRWAEFCEHMFGTSLTWIKTPAMLARSREEDARRSARERLRVRTIQDAGYYDYEADDSDPSGDPLEGL
jgi:hypothetical protein